MTWGAVIVAAGAGLRAGGAAPKQWRTLAGRPVLRWSAEALLAAGAVEVVVVTSPGAADLAAEVLAGLPRWRRVDGGVERIDSVRAGLGALAAQAPDAVLVHDAARPLVTSGHVQALLAALTDAEGALPALPVTDTLKRADAEGRVTATVDRAGLFRAQTPQAFRFDALRAAYAAWPGGAATDDAAVVEAAGGRVRLVPGDPRLLKLTYPEDFPMAEAYAAETPAAAAPAPTRTAFRTGTGLDAHVFGPGDQLMICGVSIPHTHGFLAHSDGDVGLHALTDAILGAMALGDIGDHFPPTDPQWKGAASDQFLLHALKLVGERGGRVVNADITLVCERPKVKPHREAMRARVAELLGLPLDRVSVKATTMERMGFTGREEGMVAQAAVSIEAPGVSLFPEPLLDLAGEVLDVARARRWRIATAESCTGGLVAGVLTEIAGSSAVVDRGFVTYSNQAKQTLLGVPAHMIADRGAVSEPVARRMAEGALAAASAELTVAVTGVAGPDGGTAQKPVGLVHFATAVQGGVARNHVETFGDLGRGGVRLAAVEVALRLLQRRLEEG